MMCMPSVVSSLPLLCCLKHAFEFERAPDRVGDVAVRCDRQFPGSRPIARGRLRFPARRERDRWEADFGFVKMDQADAAGLLAVRREQVVQVGGVVDGEPDAVEDAVDAERDSQIGFTAVEVVLACVHAFEGTTPANRRQ